MKAASPDLRQCQYEECSHPIVKRERESLTEFSGRKYCSLDCAHAASRRRVPSRPCGRRQCKEILVQGPNEAPSKFYERNYCSADCGNKARREAPDLSGPFVEYDINNPPPCFLSLDFFEHETRLQQSIQFNKAGPAREAKISAQMDEIRDRWCLNCPILSQCEVWAKEEGYSGVAGGHRYVEGEAQ